MRKYWKTITIVSLIFICAIVFVVVSLKSVDDQLFVYETIEGDQTAIADLELIGDLYDGMSASLAFKLAGNGHMEYLKDSKLDEKSMGYYLPNKLKTMIAEDKNFMRSKEYFSENYFYYHENKMIYANAVMEWFGYAGDKMAISALDKENGEKQEFEIKIPDAQKYNGFEVMGVFPLAHEDIMVFTENYDQTGQEGMHAYLINLKDESIENTDEWAFDSHDEDTYHELDLLADAENEKVLLAEKVFSYDEENGQERQSLGKIVLYDLKKHETETLHLPETIESVIHFDGEYIYGTTIDDHKVKLSKIRRDGKHIDETVSLDFDLPYHKNNAYQVMSQAKEDQLYLVLNDENNEGPAGIAAIEATSLDKVYLGKISMSTAGDTLEKYNYYFNHIDLK